MRGPKKLIKVPGYTISFYRCPYCKETFTLEDGLKHVQQCFEVHRNKVKEKSRKRATDYWKSRKGADTYGEKKDK